MPKGPTLDHEIKFEEVVCNLCGSKDSSVYLTRGDLNTFLPGSFTLVVCRNCGLVYQNPRPSKESFEQIYPSDYDQYDQRLHTESTIRRVSHQYGLRKRVNLILKYRKNGTLLDLGCATGDFLHEMAKQRGWEVSGVEPNLQASAYARSLGLNVITTTIDKIEFSGGQFDIITMWNVVEHLFDPIKTLEKIAHLLKPDGILIITTPNLECLDARLFGQFWIGFELPRHFYVFSNQTIRRLLTATGYSLIETRFFYGSHAAFMSSLRFWLRSKLRTHHTRFENFFFSLPVRVTTAPFFSILDRLKLSSPMTVICQKAIENT